MPIYEYRCESCGHQQEFLQKVSDPPLTVCTECGKPSFKKMVTAAGFQLKGSGWYATDFRNSGSKPKATGAAGGSSGATESKGESKSESSGESNSRESKAESTGESKSGESKSGESKTDGDSKPASPPPAATPSK
jgi:putative FmdB family regulatory protein